MAFTYILKSQIKEITYIGSTPDIARRIAEHNSGKNTFTRRYMPWTVVYSEEYSTLGEARQREKYFKSASGRRWLKARQIIPR